MNRENRRDKQKYILFYFCFREFYMLYYERKTKIWEEFKMMNFIILTASLTLSFVLAYGLVTVIALKIMSTKKAMRWYANWMEKVTNQFMESESQITGE